MFGTLSLITFAFIAIVVFVFIWPLNFSLRTKLVLSVIVCLMPCKSYISLFVGGTPFDPEIPYNLTFITDLGRSTLIFLALLVILRTILNGITKLVRWSLHASLIPANSPFYALLVFILAFAFATYGTSCGYGSPQLQKYQITMDKLDPRLDGMKIIQLADIHVSAPTDVKMIYDMVNRINALEPDLILIPGDIIDGAIKDRKPITDLLFDLKAKYGVFIATGNHEYYSGYTQWRKYFEDGGFTSLDNKVMVLADDQGKTLLNLGGITDSVASRFALPLPDIQGVTTALNDSAPSIVLSHRPEFAHELAASKKVDLVLSGHTHGGLVIGLDRIVARANGGFVSGWYDLINNTKLIVSNGTMIWMGFPLRIGVPSQINEITLHAKQKPNSQTYSLTRQGELKRLKEQAKLQANLASSHTVLSMEDNLNHNAMTKNSANLDTSSTLPKGISIQGQELPQNQSSSNQSLYVKNEAEADAGKDQLKPDFTSVQLILEMTDSQSGQIHNNVTNLAVLPENLTADQITRIQKIINEDPNKQAKAQRFSAQSPESKQPSVHIELIKDDKFSNKEQTQTTQPKSQLNTQENTGKVNASQPVQEIKPTSVNISIGQNQSLVSFGKANANNAIDLASKVEMPQTTAIKIGFQAQTQAVNIDNYLYTSLDLQEHENHQIIEPFRSSRAYFPAHDGEVAGGSNSLADELNMELQIEYSLSLGEGYHELLQDHSSVQDLLN